VPPVNEALASQYNAIRSRSLEICRPLTIEDHVVQPVDDASPPKWHLAHTTWFFETFLLKTHLPEHPPFSEAFEYLFNSYYNGVGKQFPRALRGTLSRPTVEEVHDYRRHTDQAMNELFTRELDDDLVFKITLGLHHEQQHQELMLTDLKYNLGHNPLTPAYDFDLSLTSAQSNIPLEFRSVSGGIYEIGSQPPSAELFVFDNESPRHQVLVRDFKISNRVVTNGEYLSFIEDGGYQNPALWMSDAWALMSGKEGITKPLYWFERQDGWYEYTLSGLAPLNMQTPVTHVSGYEADAYARWIGARLPTEQEWEIAASMTQNKDGNFYESGVLHPAPCAQDSEQYFGDVWEWTNSSYGPYPGFNPFPGQLGEYNGKFMANQLVLRGGSCVTGKTHIRETYRNFFYPKDKWQFTGIRLAQNL
jgi:ergothioneine biosynthesis protein EgtB